MAVSASWRPSGFGNIGNITGTTRTPIARFPGLRGCRKPWIAMAERRAVLRSLGHCPSRDAMFELQMLLRAVILSSPVHALVLDRRGRVEALVHKRIRRLLCPGCGTWPGAAPVPRRRELA